MKKRVTQAQYFIAFMIYQMQKEINWSPMDDRSFRSISYMAIKIDKEDRHEYKNNQPCFG